MWHFLNTVIGQRVGHLRWSKQLVCFVTEQYLFSSLLCICIVCPLCLSNYQVLFIILFFGIFLCSVVTLRDSAQAITTPGQSTGTKYSRIIILPLNSCDSLGGKCLVKYCFMFPSLRNCKRLSFVPRNKTNLLIWHEGSSTC